MILDHDGKEVTPPEDIQKCSKCGSKKISTTGGFGGYKSVICQDCGETLARWRS